METGVTPGPGWQRSPSQPSRPETQATTVSKLPHSIATSRASTAPDYTHGSRAIYQYDSLVPWRIRGAHREVDWLEGELQASEWRLGAAEVDRHALETQRIKLIHQVVGLDAAKRSSIREACHWRSKALDLEQALTVKSMQMDSADMLLREAAEKDKSVSHQLITSRLSEAEAKSELLGVEAQATDQQRYIQQLELQLESQEREARSQRSEVSHLREENAKLQAQHEQMQGLNVKLRAEKQVQYEALCEANRRNASMQGQIERLERNVQDNLDREMDLESKVERLEADNQKLLDANMRLRLDLQGVVSQATRAGEIPFYASGAAESPAAKVPHLPPSSSDRCRRHYPRSAHVAAKKAEILEARAQALHKMDALEGSQAVSDTAAGSRPS
mmetsp:Transcript_17807/g.41509  ORF Transcript_17807/g.41509 Transcript_17807/m.41509 type:complete len:389 (-) Transcript_17807:81-1247(-)